MREIVFRGKRIDNGEWVYGFYVCISDKHHYIFTGKITTDDDHVYFERHKVIPDTVGQYTGLTDKNGKKIFEGDIVREIFPFDYGQYENVQYVVVYSEKDCGFVPFCARDRYGDPIINECEVIGNLHDNPELLKGE